ncbi:disulfide bond formation protein B [Sphingomonas sp. CGMCC 1.13654]|uniref:Disulfide bond formation protein B n=1 Tax=Sphingomonas chungangi TaxID=2683589 RepID=A0A838L1M0_9SPHN|nr:disulfide bond formation protein B [Sphingomonas chungangi]MBA2932830.1 disulfide bond formation protein B [Sphingomonas chungangi]MVW56451.1 disulfide bond formation protein B [Sphingomonas chungangi]
MTNLSRARLIAILVPNLLLWGAIGSQYIGHLVPCEMCMWQRWPHVAAIVLALIAIALRTQPSASRAFTLLAALAILVSGGIGVYHAGVEYHWWTGPERCTGSHFTSLADLMKAPVVMCDVPQWKLAGISLAGFNAIFSILGGLATLFYASRKGIR